MWKMGQDGGGRLSALDGLSRAYMYETCTSPGGSGAQDLGVPSAWGDDEMHNTLSASFGHASLKFS